MSNPYDKIAHVYDKAFLYKTSLVEDELVYGWLDKFLHKSSIIDLGCGTGAFLEHLKWEDYIGIDLSKRMVHLAKKKFPHHSFVICDMRKLPFKANTFKNVVSLYGPISYAGKQALLEAQRVLTNGGRFFHMAFTEKYAKRKTYILNRLKLKLNFVPYSGLASVVEHKTKGFNVYGDSLEKLPKQLIKILMLFDPVSKINKFSSYFIIMYGEKK